MLNPRFIDRMSWSMAEVYGSVTDQIMVNLAKYFPYIRNDDEALGAFEYQAKMLAKMGQVNSETVRIIAAGLDGADAALRDTLEAAIRESLRDAEPKLRKAAEKGLLQGPGFLPPEVVPSEMQAFEAYYRQAADHLNLVNTVMLESTEAAYQATVADVAAKIQRTQSILNTETGKVITGVSSHNEAVRQAVDRMVENGLTGFVDHGDHHWSPEAYAAMDIRTTAANAARAASWEINERYDNDLYQVSSHNGARPLCYPWQGKVISRTDNERDVEDFDGNTVHVYAQSATSYGQPAGLFGINCRHYPSPFIPGFSTISGEPQDEEENEQLYALTQEQRGMERKLRGFLLDERVLKAQGAPEEEIRKAHAAVTDQRHKLDMFCEDHGLPRRRDREYTPIKAEWPEEEKQ